MISETERLSPASNGTQAQPMPPRSRRTLDTTVIAVRLGNPDLTREQLPDLLIKVADMVRQQNAQAQPSLQEAAEPNPDQCEAPDEDATRARLFNQIARRVRANVEHSARTYPQVWDHLFRTFRQRYQFDGFAKVKSRGYGTPMEAIADEGLLPQLDELAAEIL